MADIGRLSVGGGVAFWKPAEGTNHGILNTALLRAGLEQFVPPKRTEASALRGALEETFHGVKNVLIRGMKKPDIGFTVANERKGTAEDEWSGEQFLACHLRKNGERSHVEFKPWSYNGTNRITEVYANLFDTLPAASVTSMLVKILDDMGAVMLRESGGFYWIDETAFRVWERVTEAVESAGAFKVYLMKCIADEHMARAVTDSLIEEMDRTARRIERDVTSGELGEDALTNRTKEALAARERLAHFEGLFGVALEGVRADMDKVTKAAASCTLQAAAIARGL